MTVSVAGNSYVLVPGSGQTQILNDFNISFQGQDQYGVTASEAAVMTGLQRDASILLTSIAPKPNPALGTDALPIAGFDVSPFSVRQLNFDVASFANGSQTAKSSVTLRRPARPRPPARGTLPALRCVAAVAARRLGQPGQGIAAPSPSSALPGLR